MPNAQSALIVVALVAGGVMLAGYVMNKFQGEVQFLADASNGFQGL